jgi:hypothetical protein
MGSEEDVVRKATIFCCLLLIAASAKAQSNDVALTGGGYLAASNPLNLGAAWALEGTFAHRIYSLPLVAISAELPIAGSTQSPIPTLSGLTLTRGYSSLFITPGLRLTLAPSFFISPYLSAGIGYGRFNQQLFTGGTSANGSAAFDIGGGLDLKILPHVSLRGELRDFNSGGVGLQTLVFGRQNNLFATVGLAIRF